jgi:phosphonate transport system substrate-binding protein
MSTPDPVRRRQLLLAGIGTLCGARTAAQEAAPAAAAGEWLIAVSEGTSGSQSTLEVMARYEELVRVIGRAVNRKVGFFLARDFEMLEDGVRRQAYHLVLARPSDYPARAMRDRGYQLVVTTRGDGYIRFIVPKDSPLKSVREISGRRIAFPEDISYAARVAAATLRDNGIEIGREKSVQHFRDQAAIGFVLEAGLADVGAVMSYSGVGRDWEKKGGRVLLDGPRKPYMPMVASPRVSAQELAQLRAALVALDQTPAGQAALKRIGIAGFEPREPGDLIALLKWLGM